MVTDMLALLDVSFYFINNKRESSHTSAVQLKLFQENFPWHHGYYLIWLIKKKAKRMEKLSGVFFILDRCAL
jgi:hypothetical protein